MQEEIDRIVCRLNADKEISSMLAMPAEGGTVPTSKDRTNFFVAITLLFKQGHFSIEKMHHCIRLAVYQVANSEALSQLHIVEFVVSLLDADGGMGRVARIIVAREGFGQIETNLQVDYSVSRPAHGVKTIWYFEPQIIQRESKD